MRNSTLSLLPLLLFGSAGMVIARGSSQSANAPVKVAFCQMVTAPAKYDGSYVITEAVIGNQIHSLVVFDPLCSETGRYLGAQPTFHLPYKLNSPLDRVLRKALDQDGSARIIFVARFSGGGLHGPDGFPFTLELQSLIAVHRIGSAEREALGIGTGKGP